MSKLIFMDESGYTGEDLANEDQPCFAVSSVKLTEKKATDLKEKYFGEVSSEELKYSNLSKNHRTKKT